jgi:DNA-binding PadR family transcriptional regulator
VKVGTKHAVLGLLLDQPSYGYEVLVRFRRAFDVAQWDISPQGLYASLDRLERDGLIESVGVSDDTRRRQPKTPYRVTPSGADELRQFLETPMGAALSPAELLVRLRCVAVRDAEALLHMLDDHEQACLDELGRLGAGAAGSGRAAHDSLVERLALEERRLGIQARLLWIDYARHELRAPDAPHPRDEVATR